MSEEKIDGREVVDTPVSEEVPPVADAADVEEITEGGGEAEDEGKKGKKRLLLLLALAGIVVVALIIIAVVLLAPKPTTDGQGTTPPAKVETGNTEKKTLPDAMAPTAQKPDTDKDEASEPGNGVEELPVEAGTPASGTAGGGSSGNTGSGSGAGSGAGAGSGSGGGSTGGSGGSNKTWHEGWNEWVVDVPGHNERQLVSAAWDEETGHWGDRCNDCGAEVTGAYVPHAKATGHNNGYSSPFWFAGGTIHHDAVYQDVWIPEQGHNVWHEGYWE